MTAPASETSPSRQPKHVLVVALSFPPSAAAAALPTAHLASYLHDHGWFATFLTVHASRLRMPHAEGEGYPLPAEGIAVRRTRIVYPWDTLRRFRPRLPARATSVGEAAAAAGASPRRGSWPKLVLENALKLPDEFRGWVPFAAAAGRALARERPVHCLYTVGPPMTGHVVGLRLHRRLRCPWVADFHDPWLANPWRKSDRPWPLQGIEERLEQAVMRSADRFVTKTPEMAELLSRTSGRPLRDFTVATGAYDAEEVQSVAAEVSRDRSRFVLIHAGHFYGPRSPAPLLHALAQVANDPELAGRLELRLVGGRSPAVDTLARQLGIWSLVNQVGLVSHREVLRHLLGSDVAIIVQPDTWVQVPAKLYEYLGCGVPVLALAGEGAAARVVREAKAGLVVPPDDVGAIASALRTCLAQAESLRAGLDRDFIAQFEVKRVVAKVAALLDELCP